MDLKDSRKYNTQSDFQSIKEILNSSFKDVGIIINEIKHFKESNSIKK